jgi:hypothetical protein
MIRKTLGWSFGLSKPLYVCLLEFVFLGLFFESLCFVTKAGPQNSLPNPTARVHVAELKKQLKVAEQQYSGVLADNVSGAERSAIEHVEQLRGNLKVSVVRWLSQSTNSEVSLAVNKAAVDSFLDAVHAYEQAVGIGVVGELLFRLPQGM